MNLEGNEREIFKTNHTIDEATATRLRIKVHPPGTVIFPKIGGAIATNKRRVIVRPTAIDNNCLGIIPKKSCSTEWLFLVLSAIDFTIYQAGTSVPALSQGTIGEIEVSLPPLAEQCRIVAKVEELLALCDEMEARQTVAREQRTHLVRSALDHLTTAQDEIGFKKHSAFCLQHSELLFDSVSALRQAILSLAVRGKLVPFKATDKQTVGDHIEFLNGYAFKSEWFKPSGIRLCRNANVSHGVLDWRESAFVDTKVAKEFERFALVDGDIVLSLDRPLISTGLKVARVTKAELPCLLLQRVAKPVPKHDKVDLTYFLLWLNSPEFVDSIDPGRSNGVPHISTRQVQSLPFGLPSLAEQQRIVAKVDELMRWCDALEARLAESQTTATHLLDAILQQALAPTLAA